MLAEVPEDKRKEASQYLKAVQDGLKKVQGAIDLKWVHAGLAAASHVALHIMHSFLRWLSASLTPMLPNAAGLALLCSLQVLAPAETCPMLASNQLRTGLAAVHVFARSSPGCSMLQCLLTPNDST